MSDTKEKKIGGIYTIEDPDLRAAMIKESTEGERCDYLKDFMDEIFEMESKKLFGSGKEIPNDGYLVCFMPGSYEHDLANEIGAASAVDAAKLYTELIAEGYTILVWDGRNRKMHRIPWSEYISGESGDE